MKKLLMVALIVPVLACAMQKEMDLEQLTKLLRTKDTPALDTYCEENAPKVRQKMGEAVCAQVLAAWPQERKQELLWCVKNQILSQGRSDFGPHNFGEQGAAYRHAVITTINGQEIVTPMEDFIALAKLHEYKPLVIEWLRKDKIRHDRILANPRYYND